MPNRMPAGHTDTSIARAREEESWFAIELLVVAGIVGLSMLIATEDFWDTTMKFKTNEALFLIVGTRVSAMEFRALHGRWPNPNETQLNGVPNLAQTPSGLRGTVTDFEQGPNGSITMILRTAPKASGHLTFRPATVASNPSSPTIWLCGYSTPPAGFIASGTSSTDIRPKQLPAACRDKRKKIQVSTD